MMIAERLFFSFLLVSLAIGTYIVWSWGQRRLLNGRFAPAEKPALLYFYSHHCATCPTQAHYLTQVSSQWAQQVTIRPIDVEQEPQTAVAYRIMSLPTTLLVAENGKVHSINYGLTNSHKINQQIKQLVK